MFTTKTLIHWSHTRPFTLTKKAKTLSALPKSTLTCCRGEGRHGTFQLHNDHSSHSATTTPTPLRCSVGSSFGDCFLKKKKKKPSYHDTTTTYLRIDTRHLFVHVFLFFLLSFLCQMLTRTSNYCSLNPDQLDQACFSILLISCSVSLSNLKSLFSVLSWQECHTGWSSAAACNFCFYSEKWS